MYLEQNMSGRVVLTQLDAQAPYLILNDLESDLFRMMFNQKSLQVLPSPSVLNDFKTMLNAKGIWHKMINLDETYKYSENLMIKIMPDNRISLVMANDIDSMFVIDGLMAEVFHDLGKANLTLNAILAKHLNEYEDSEHAELTQYITDFYKELCVKGIITSI